MHILISEVRAALKLKLYMPGLITLFAIPDAAASVEYGYLAPSKRYPKWYDDYVGKGFGMDGQLAWMVRNALIHETATNWRAGGYEFDRLVIGVPTMDSQLQLDGVAIARKVPGAETVGPATLHIELDTLANSIVTGALDWLKLAEKDEAKAARLGGMMQVRPHGFTNVKNKLSIW